MSKKTLSIALLVADTPVPPVVERYGAYDKIFPNFLKLAGNTVKRHNWQETVR